MYEFSQTQYVDVQEDYVVFLSAVLSRYIDEGHNPELFTSHQLEQSLADYRAVQKKVQAYKVSLFWY